MFGIKHKTHSTGMIQYKSTKRILLVYKCRTAYVVINKRSAAMQDTVTH